MTGKYPSDPVRYLREQKYRDGLDAFMARLPLNGEEERLRATVVAYQAELRNLNAVDLEMRARQQMHDDAQALENLDHRAQFFDQANDVAACDYWLKLPLWTLEEAIIISLGKDPRRVKSCHLEGNIDFDNRKRRVLSAKEAGQLSFPISPKAFLSWVNSPVGDLDTAKPDASEDPVSNKSNQPLNGKERNNFLKLISVMARSGYAYDPGSSRSSTVREIAENSKNLGLPIDEDTIRSKLKEASARFPALVLPANG